MKSSSKLDAIHQILGIEDAFLAPAALREILFQKERREEVFRKLLKLHDYDLSYDWFHQYFQEEHADRKSKKQDFTPQSVAKLLHALVGTDQGSYFECACGTGGLVITAWNDNRLKVLPWEYNPMNHFFQLEELSDRTIPFLLLNLMIRGINATVMHGNSLTRKSKGVFFVQNFENQAVNFSDLHVFPYTKATEELFQITFEKQEYPEHVERSHADFIEEVSDDTD
ncbi:MAG: N-6 DNA methylase [Peptostreptococcaceae bacterium]|nr:N-6 DNA methylase [Peptostreptococcaceae bacterium]